MGGKGKYSCPKRSFIFLAAIVLCTAASVYALYEVNNFGDWPKTWPAELEPLRKQATTLVGPEIALRHYLIPFTDREQFEAAWPYLLKVKSKSAPIILVRGPKTDFMAIKPAGVLIHSPPLGSTNAQEPILGLPNVRERWMNTTFIELVVDGKIIDLNRIPLPPDTPIIDARFNEGGKSK